MVMTSSHRYSRQTILPEIGEKGQDRLRSSRILCVGAGGLGCPALQYLVAAGCGHIGIVDDDTVDLSNLQRQTLYTESQIGQLKAIAAVNILQDRNTDVTFTPYTQRLDLDLCQKIFPLYDVIIDAADNFTTTFLINDAARAFKTPWVYGAILGFQGQLSVFHGDHGPCYRCIFPIPPQQNVMNCAEAGIVGSVAGVIGAMQALEAIKVVINSQDIPPMTGQFLQLDLKMFQNRLTNLPEELTCTTCNLDGPAILEEGRKRAVSEGGLMSCIHTGQDEINLEDTKTLLAGEHSVKLIDVREIEEWDAGHIEGADHCPLSFLLEGMRPDNLEKDTTLILYCKAGMRSLQAVHILKTQGYHDIKSMKGGYDAWIRSQSYTTLSAAE